MRVNHLHKVNIMVIIRAKQSVSIWILSLLVYSVNPNNSANLGQVALPLSSSLKPYFSSSKNLSHCSAVTCQACPSWQAGRHSALCTVGCPEPATAWNATAVPGIFC